MIIVRYQPIKPLLILFFSLVIFSAACTDIEVPDGHMVVKNDIRDKSYNIVNVRTSGGRSFRASLKPGEHVVLPKGVRTIHFSRQYEDHTKAYIVQCPRVLSKGIITRLIDVHSNRIGAGCKLINRGRSHGSSNYIRWEKSL